MSTTDKDKLKADLEAIFKKHGIDTFVLLAKNKDINMGAIVGKGVDLIQVIAEQTSHKESLKELFEMGLKLGSIWHQFKKDKDPRVDSSSEDIGYTSSKPIRS